MQMECQVAVRKAQALAAFCNAENAMLSSRRKLFAQLGRAGSGDFTNRQVNGKSLLGYCPGSPSGQDTFACLSGNCIKAADTWTGTSTRLAFALLLAHAPGSSQPSEDLLRGCVVRVLLPRVHGDNFVVSARIGEGTTRTNPRSTTKRSHGGAIRLAKHVDRIVMRGMRVLGEMKSWEGLS